MGRLKPTGRGRARSARGPVRVLAADSEPLYRAAVTSAIRERRHLELVADAADGERALREIVRLEPDVAVLEFQLPGLAGARILSAVAEAELRTRIVFLSSHADPAVVYRAIADGAAAYLTKAADADQICDAIRAVARGDAVLGPELQAGVAREIRLRAVAERPFLSDREREVLKLIASGCSAPEISSRIHLSTATVKTHLQHIYAKLGVSERAAAVAQAMRRGLVE